MRTLKEAVVLFDYEKQEDDELSLKVGDIITDVKQVCAACCAICILVESSGMLGQSNLKLVSSAASWYHLVCMTCFGEYHYAGKLSDINYEHACALYASRTRISA